MGRIRQIVGMTLLVPVFALLGLLTIIFGNLLRFLHLYKAADAVIYVIIQVIIRWIYITLGALVKVEGRENIPQKGERICYVPNHSSMVDIPVILGSGMWCGLVAKQELYKVPVLHGLLKVLHCLPIDRSSLRESAKTIFKGADQIKAGIPMCIFPEGTRSKTGVMGEMKAGAFKMAIKAKAKIVPVALGNTRFCLEGARSIKPVHVYVKILPAIDTASLSEDELKEVHTYVENMIRREVEAFPGPDGR